MEVLFEKKSRLNNYSKNVLLPALCAAIFVFCPIAALYPKIGLGVSIAFVGLFISLKYRNLPFYLLIALFPVLPMYFALDLGTSLPLFTFYRLLAIYFIFFELFFNRKANIESLIVRLKNLKINKYIIFYSLIVACGTAYSFNGESIKSVISIVIENILIFYMVIRKLDNMELFNKAVKVLIIAALTMSILGIVEGILHFNFFSLLDMHVRDGLVLDVSSYSRMGSDRVETSFGHPIGYGLYLVLIVPIVMYKMMQKDKLATVTFGLLVVNLLLTISRGPILAFIISMILFFLLSSKKTKVRSLCLGLALIFIISIYVNVSKSATAKTIKNIPLAMMGLFDQRYKVDDFGKNEDPYAYRVYLVNLTLQTLKHDLLFGKGRGFFRNHYLSGVNEVGSPMKITSIDNNYLYLLIETGVLGSLAAVLLQIKFILLCIFSKQKDRKLRDGFNFYVLLSLIAYYIALVTVASLNTERVVWIVYALLASYLSISNKEQMIEASNINGTKKLIKEL